jgi:hypothetical protein
MLYAHPSFATLLEQIVYRPASPLQRASLSPMPLPAIALVASAVSNLISYAPDHHLLLVGLVLP